MSNNKILTVAVPNYNGGPFIEDTISSCKYLNLSFDQYEILVIDNMSTDDSVKKVDALAAAFPNIRLVINKTNLGRLGNWERCIQLSEGKYITFLFITNEFHMAYDINKGISILENNADISMHISTMLAVKKAGRHTIGNRFYDTDKRLSSKEFIKATLAKGSEVPGYLQSNIMRTEDLRGLKFNEEYPFTADQIFACEAIIKRKEVYISANPAVLWKINKNPNRFTKSVPIEKITDQLLYAAHFQAACIDIKDSKLLTKYYARQLWRVLDLFVSSRKIISEKSNYVNAVRIVFSQARIKKINLIHITYQFVIYPFKKLACNYFKKN